MLEAYPARADLEQAGAGLVHREGVLTAQVHGHRRRGVHEEASRRRPDPGMEHAAVQSDAVRRGSCVHETQPRTGLDLHLPDGPDLHARARRDIGFQPFPNPKPLDAGHGPTRRRAREPRDFPRRSRAAGGDPEAGHREEESGRGGERGQHAAEGPPTRGRQLRGRTGGA